MAQPTLMDVPVFLIYFCVAVCVCARIFKTSLLWLAVGPRSLWRGGGLFAGFWVCVLLITRLLRLVGRLSARKPV